MQRKKNKQGEHYNYFSAVSRLALGMTVSSPQFLVGASRDLYADSKNNGNDPAYSLNR